jgi:hypothetical protein
MTDAIKQATSHWEVGNVKITRVIELEHDSFPPGFLFDGLTKDRVKSIGWLHPNYADPDGTIWISIHAYVIESQGGESSWTHASVTTSRAVWRTGT